MNGRLEGAGDAFPAGSRVAFASRVLGGHAGEVIRHAWLFDGRLQQSIPLRLGGPDWRTHSAKLILHPGAWAVEARDDAGHVLARSEFSCRPDSP